MFLKPMGQRGRLFDGEIKNYKSNKKFIVNNPQFRQVEIYMEGKLIYRTLPMATPEAKELVNHIDTVMNNNNIWSIMNLFI